MNVYNVTATNTTGPLFQAVDILAHNFSTLSFNEMYTSQELNASLQSMIYFAKTNAFSETGLDPSRSQDTFFDHIDLKGYTTIDRIDYTESANNSIFISGFTNYGKYILGFLFKT